MSDDKRVIPDGPPALYGRDYYMGDRRGPADDYITAVDVDREEADNPDLVEDWIRHGGEDTR